MPTSKIYTTAEGNYTLSSVNSLQVEEHCHQYMDSITGVIFHESEINDLLTNMYKADKAVVLTKNGEQLAYLYMVAVGKLRHNIITLHYLVENEITKAIIEHEIYSMNSILRYVPKDPEVLLHTHLLQPLSRRLFIRARTPRIKMIQDLDTQTNLTNLNIQVL
jgi:hypothetical protein